MVYHLKTINEIFKEFKTGYNGLTEKQAGSLLKKGRNVLVEPKKESFIKIFLNQFTSPLILLLLMSSFILFFLSIFSESASLIDAIMIFIIIIANSIFGFFQDYKAEKSVESLKKMLKLNAKVIRGGKIKEIPSEEVVPGDILIVGAGDQVSADARIISSKSLTVDESILTGESTPVRKISEKLTKAKSFFVIKNMLFKGTNISSGEAKAIVIKTGMDTKIGHIVKKMHEITEEKTIFQNEMNVLGKQITIIIGFIILFIGIFQFFTSSAPLIQIIILSIALAVAAIPEGLPAVITLSLAIGTNKMLRKKALVRKLNVVESLGSVTLICTDKTGTLTENKTTATDFYIYDEYTKEPDKIKKMLTAAVHCNNSFNDRVYKGEALEVALMNAGEEFGIERKFKKIDEKPFSPEYKHMITVHKKDDKFLSFIKGAPEVVINKSSRILINGEIKKLTPGIIKEIYARNTQMASKALRVIAFGFKESNSSELPEKGFIFLGLIGTIDPPRKGVKEALQKCNEAGIRVIMITGDNAVTAKAVGKKIGFKSKVIEGHLLESMPKKEFAKIVREEDIFARVSPLMKVKILEELQKDNIVAMTGDGINDAPALKKANVGIAMGIRGSDVAKQASDLIILDDDFVTIVSAIEQGRTIFDNIRKFVDYLLTSNLAEVGVVLIGSFFGYIPLTAVQLLWINLLTDGMPALALGADPSSPGIMKRKPRKLSDKVINRRIYEMILFIGIKKTFFAVLIFLIGVKFFDFKTGATMLFTSIILYEFVRIGAIRRMERLSWFSNKWLLVALSSSVMLQLFVIYSPLNVFFSAIPLSLIHWMIILPLIALSYVLAIVITDYVVKRTPEDAY